jgi:hypothetical protein
MLLFLSACVSAPEPASPASADPQLQASPTAPGSEPPEPARWLVAVWMDGDNNLERFIDDDIDELERAKVDGVNIVVQADRSPEHTEGGGDWTDTRRFEIVADTERGPVSPLIEELGEVDMGDGTELAAFLQWAWERYPADRVAVILWNHGGGFWIASDDTSRSKIFLHDGELNAALQPLVDLRGAPIDLVAFDACNMGEWEVAATLAGQVRVMTASQAWVDFEGYAYDAVFPELPQDADAAVLGDRLAYSAGVLNEELTHAAIDLEAIASVSSSVDALAAALLADPDGMEAFVRARQEARGLDQQWEDFWLDLGSFADALEAGASPDVAAAAQQLRQSLDASIIGNYRDERLAFASGLTIMADTSKPSWFERYGMGPWASTRWDELLVAVAEAELAYSMP